MKERRKHKCGSRKDKGMKHSYVERLAALMLCAALLVSNAVISRADDEAEVPQMVETVNEERNADAGMQTEEPGVDGEDSQKESPSKENNGTGDQEQSQIPGTAVQRMPTNRRISAEMQKIQALTELRIPKSICRPSEKTVTLIIMVQKQPERKMAKPMRMVMAKCRMRTVKSPGLTKTGRL